MTDNQLVSVIMPVFNCEDYLEESMVSILNQTYPYFEFIIINDGSNDRSPEIIQRYSNKDNRIRIIDQSNCGIITAVNRGISEAKCEWLFRMDGDDVALPHRLEIQIEEIKKKPSLVLLGGWCQQINNLGDPIEINKYPACHNKLVARFERGMSMFPHPSVCFRKDSIIKLGGYRKRFLYSEDQDLWARIIHDGEIGCCQSVVIKLRGNKDQIIKNRHVYNFAARICYNQRKIGLLDLSQAENDVWQEFINWIAMRLEEMDYYKQKEEWMNVRKILVQNSKTYGINRFYGLVVKLAQNYKAWGTIWSKLFPKDIALLLAKESKDVF